jgi:radical SAM superfamily enzyme YgiQ (UPF0313 family)
MRILLVSPIEDVSVPSLRYLSAYLKKQGHATTLVLLPWAFTDPALNPTNSFLCPYPEDVLDQVADLSAGADMVGLSLMSCHFDNSVRITRHLRKRYRGPIIWGGTHPTIRPAECLQYADLVCVGEGEISFAALADRMDSGGAWEGASIPGILDRTSTNTASPAPGSLVQDLDLLPLPDYELDRQFVLFQGRLVPMTAPLLATCMGNSYQAMFSRGCPYACTYCFNNSLMRLYGCRLPVRWRSLELQIAELEEAKRLLPDLRVIGFADDAFLSRPAADLDAFTQRYRERIDLPFMLLATPRSVTVEKIARLTAAGLYHIGIGIQSGSERIYKKLYHRPESLKEVLAASHNIVEGARVSRKRVMVRYDFILDNPWEEESDAVDSIRFCLRLPRPFNIAMFSLTFYPGTALYEKARTEGKIHDDLTQIYRFSQLVPRRTYMNGVYAAVSANAPRWIIRMLLWRRLRRLASPGLPYTVAVAFEFLKYVRGLLGYAFRGEWGMIGFFLRPALGRLRSMVHYGQMPSPRRIFAGGPGEIGGEPHRG